MEQFLIILGPHGGATSHTPEDHWVSTQEICRQPCVQLATCRDAGTENKFVKWEVEEQKKYNRKWAEQRVKVEIEGGIGGKGL